MFIFHIKYCVYVSKFRNLQNTLTDPLIHKDDAIVDGFGQGRLCYGCPERIHIKKSSLCVHRTVCPPIHSPVHLNTPFIGVTLFSRHGWADRHKGIFSTVFPFLPLTEFHSTFPSVFFFPRHSVKPPYTHAPAAASIMVR